VSKTGLILHIFAACITVSAAVPAPVSASDMVKFLPTPACTENWNLDGKPALFDKDTLFDRINGESELYFPYGFDLLAYGRYENKQNPMIAIDMDVYRMGSLLDAFGMFANYRKKKDEAVALGVEGTLSESQVFFYAARYFVRLQVTGATDLDRRTLLQCAQSVAARLPSNTARPKELEALDVPGVDRGTERYIAQSLLGYEFFQQGLVAGLSGGAEAQVFVVLGQSAESARKTLRQYRDYLASGGNGVTYKEEKAGSSLEGKDPLYGAVRARQKNSIVVGVIRASDGREASELLDRVVAKIRRE
jgi:hypothetical protein